MIWVTSTAAKLVAAPLAAKAGAGLPGQTGSPFSLRDDGVFLLRRGSVECGFFGLQPALDGLAAAHAVVQEG